MNNYYKRIKLMLILNLIFFLYIKNFFFIKFLTNFLFNFFFFFFLFLVCFIFINIFYYGFYYLNSNKNFFFFLIFFFFFFISIIFLLIRNRITIIFLGWDGLGITSFILVSFFNNWNTINNRLLTFTRNRFGDVFLFIFLSFFFFFFS